MRLTSLRGLSPPAADMKAEKLSNRKAKKADRFVSQETVKSKS